jgi:hypothetical protein
MIIHYRWLLNMDQKIPGVPLWAYIALNTNIKPRTILSPETAKPPRDKGIHRVPESIVPGFI